MKLLKNRLFLAGMMIFILIAMAAPVFAADHNYQYEFHLQVGGKNSYLSSSESKYRQTTNPSNPWKVNMSNIRDDSDGIATYWIARNADHVQVSDAHNVHAGTGAHYYNVRSSANQTTVVLAADNNNNVAARVWGYWDEETH